MSGSQAAKASSILLSTNKLKSVYRLNIYYIGRYVMISRQDEKNFFLQWIDQRESDSNKSKMGGGPDSLLIISLEAPVAMFARKNKISKI